MARQMYVAGPVFEWGSGRHKIFEAVTEEAARLGSKVVLPVRDEYVDQLEPTRFTEHIVSEIEEADGVVTILAAGDQSVPVESAIAAMKGKRQIIVAEDGHKAPRILAGLPGVVDVVRFDDHEALAAGMSRLTMPDEASSTSW